MGSYLSQFTLFNKQKNITGSINPVLFISFLLLFFTFLSGKTFAAARTASVSGLWSDIATWGGAAVPTSADAVTINQGLTITIDIAAECSSLTFGAITTTNTVLTISGTNTLVVTGLISMPRPSIGETCTFNVNAGAVTCGSLTMAATTSTRNDIINISTGSLVVNGTITTGTTGCVITFSDAGTLQLSGTTSGGPPTMTPSTGTVIYDRPGAQTVWGSTYNNLILAGSGAKTFAVTTINNDLTLTGTATATTGAALNVGGNLIIGDGTTLTAAAFALTVAGTTTVGSGTSGILAISSATGTKAFTGDVTITAGGTWSETAAATVNFAGSLTNNAATFTASTGTHTFSGASKILSGSTTTSIGSVDVSGTYTNNGTLTVGTALSGAGALTNASTLNIGGTTSITTLDNSGTIDKSGTGTITTVLANFTNTGTINISGSGTITGITNNTGGIVNHSGSGTITSFNNATATSTLNISSTPTVPTITTLTVSATGNTVNYTGLGSQTVKAVSYENLILSGSGAKSMLAGTAVLGEMSIAPTGSATASVGAGLNLIVNSLLLAGANQVSGTYGSTSSSATFQNNTFFAATTGILSVNMPVISTAAGGDWATTTTWVGNIVPVANQQVVIATTGAGAVTTVATYTCAGLTINSGAILTLKRNFTVNGTTSIFGTINFGSTNTTVRVMTFNDSVTINSGAVWDETNGGANTVLNTYFFSNSLINDATTFTSLTGLHTFSGTGMTLSGGTTTSIANVAVTGTYTNSGTLTVGTTLSGSGTLTNGNGATGTLNIGGTATIAVLTASAANNTVNYTGGAQTVDVPTFGIYHHLTFSGSAAKTLNVGITAINGDFTMAGTAATTGLVGLTIGGTVTLGSGTTFTAGAFTHNVGGDWINNGGTFTNTGSTINFNGTGVQSINTGGSSFNNFTITNTTGACTALTNNITVAGTFTTDANTILDMGTNPLIVNTVAHSGTLKTQNTSATPITITKTWGGIVQYNGAAAQTIVDANYNNLDGTGGDRTLSSTGTIFIAGTFTVGAGTYTVTSSTVDFNGTAAQSIPAFNFNNLTISGNKGGGAMTLVNGGTVGVAAVFSVTATNTFYIVTGNTFDYNGGGAQTIIAPFVYNNLAISNAGVKTILTATTVDCQTITFNGTATLDILGTGLFNVLG